MPPRSPPPQSFAVARRSTGPRGSANFGSELVPEAIRHAEVAGHLGGDPLVELRLGCRIQRALRRGDIFHDLPRIGPRRVRVDSEPLQLLRQVVRHDKLP